MTAMPQLPIEADSTVVAIASLVLRARKQGIGPGDGAV